jgi:phosphatidylserine/phosphatidylglycerophosphate/cardiolipin synthase-like enzyme
VPVAFDAIVRSGALVWTDSITFVSDQPGKNSGADGLGGGGASTDALIALIRGAERSVTIQSPYFVTTAVGQDLFREAIARGVRVRILTNSLGSTDNLEAFSGYQRTRATLLEIGVEIYEYRPDAAIRREIMSATLQGTLDFTPIFGLHAKSMVVDERIAVIGTFNLDPRSANLNTECIAVIHDARIAGAVLRSMEADIRPENAWRTTADFNPDAEAGWSKRARVWMRRIVPKAVL